MNTLDVNAVYAWINLAASTFEAKKAYLTDLDAPIGDSDHGENMSRGFTAVKAKLVDPRPENVSALFKTIAMTLLSTVGGASGPLYATFFLQAAAKAGTAPSIDLATWTECLEAALKGVMDRGKAIPGDKTMVDALTPALEALKAASSDTLSSALTKSAKAAEMGMMATIPMNARKGRASYLGERSIGHQDPGATSTFYLLTALAEIAAK